MKYSVLVLISQFYLFLVFFLGIPCFYYLNKNIFMEMVRDMRWLRLAHYFMMLALGCALAMSQSQDDIYAKIFHDHAAIFCNFIFCLISILFAAIFSIISNNIADQEIDRISNQTRPLVSGKISLPVYGRIGNAALVAALIYAVAAGVQALFLISMMIVSYYIYSMPPLRFKRVLLFSKLAISLNSLFMIFLGYGLLQGNFRNFPPVMLSILLIGFTLTANVIDIKDYAGDKAGGIKTLPGWLGLRYSRLLIGAAFLLTYASFGFLMNSNYYFLLFSLLGLIQFFLVNKKNYEEGKVFIFNLMSMGFFIVLLVRV